MALTLSSLPDECSQIEPSAIPVHRFILRPDAMSRLCCNDEVGFRQPLSVSVSRAVYRLLQDIIQYFPGGLAL